MSRKVKLVLLAGVLALVIASAAFAGLSAVGVSPNFNPVTTSNGFPQWYTDANGVSVELPIPPLGDGLTAPTMIYQPLDPVSNAVALRAGFDTEAFYFLAKADPKNFLVHGTGKIVTVLGLEASYSIGSPAEGAQVVFARIRIAAPVTVPGTYTFSHPWGVETIVVTQADIDGKHHGIFFTKDFGLSTGWNPDGAGGWLPAAAPAGFYSVLQSGNIMSTFLTALVPAPPAGWIGDGVTLSTVTGSPTGYNKVRLEGPDANLDGAGHNFVETDKFVVAGHIPASTAIPLPLSVDRATASYVGTAKTVGLFLTSKQGAIVTVTDAALGTVLYTGSVTDASGRFYQSFPALATTDSIAVGVTPTSAGFTPNSQTVPVVDFVKITSARYSAGTNSLTVTATSSGFFAAAAPTLTVVGFGVMTADASGTYTLPPVTLTSPLPPSVTVTSTMGGTNTAPVDDTPLAIIVTAPNGGESWANGSAHNLSWTLSAAASVGAFNVWLIDGVGNWVAAGDTVAAVPGQTIYSVPWTVTAAPRADYRLTVWYRPDATVWGGWLANDESNAAFTVTGAPLAVTVTAPNGGESWANGISQNLDWTLNTAVAVGALNVWLIDGAGNWVTTVGTVAATGLTAYSVPWTVAAPARADYKLSVWYRPDATVWGGWTASDESNATFTVTP